MSINGINRLNSTAIDELVSEWVSGVSASQRYRWDDINNCKGFVRLLISSTKNISMYIYFMFDLLEMNIGYNYIQIEDKWQYHVILILFSIVFPNLENSSYPFNHPSIHSTKHPVVIPLFNYLKSSSIMEKITWINIFKFRELADKMGWNTQWRFLQ